MNTFFTTSRITGLFYLALGITGMFTFLFVRSEIYVDGDAIMTTANLFKQESLVRLGIASSLALVAFQALAATWFYKLFRTKSQFGAGLIAVFGMANAVALLIASAVWLSALNVTLSGGPSDTVYALFGLHDNIWTVGGIFFGLWLLPMAYMAKLSKMPRALVWFLAAGGTGYILATFSSILLPEQPLLAELLPIPATVGEFWMIGYLLRGTFPMKMSE